MTKLPTVSKQELLNAIRDGVHDAMWRMITNATASSSFMSSARSGLAMSVKRAEA
jgi:hypothetical protein